MTAEKATKSGHYQVTRLEACFVVIFLIFNNLSAIFSHKRWQWLQLIRPNCGERNPRFCHQLLQIYSLLCMTVNNTNSTSRMHLLELLFEWVTGMVWHDILQEVLDYLNLLSRRVTYQPTLTEDKWLWTENVRNITTLWNSTTTRGMMIYTKTPLDR